MKNLVVSFSGGETSAFMAQWIRKNLINNYDKIVYVFANTGLENEQTLEFIRKCDDYWSFDIQWVEASVNHGERKGTGYSLTNFKEAKRKGEPFEAMIQKYGIPNPAFPHCTRELKQAPIREFGKNWFNAERYDTAIGIRNDEIDRINEKAKEQKLIYPLIDMISVNKPMINTFWDRMPFRLELKGYQGNCVTCWKKADKKLFQIYKENPQAFDFMAEMESKYPSVGYEFTKYLTAKHRVFFRNHRSVTDIIAQAKNWQGSVKNDADDYTYQIDLLGGDSCEIFAECN
jgi:hypothetical protein